MTTLIKWDEKFSVGVEEIDGQHKALFNILGQLIEATSPGKAKERIGVLFDEMADYAKYHFKTEQAYLQKHPEFSSHLKQHSVFVEKTIQLQKNYLKENSPRGLTHHNALVFLLSWLQKHILECDVIFFSSLPSLVQDKA